MSAVGPIRVAVVDVASPIADLHCRREGTPYAGAWILACRAGLPLGSIELALDGTVIPAAVLERELRAGLGDAWSRTPPSDAPSPAKASVVVPTAVSRPEQLRRCVARLTELDHPDYEVIVVDNRREGPLVALPGVRVIRESRPGISAARNAGLAVATGEIIAFTDDDVEVDRHWLRAIGERFARQPELAAVTGLVVPAELETAAQIFFEQSGSGLDRGYDALEFERTGHFQIRRRSLQDGSERVHSLYQTGGEDLAMLMELIVAGRRVAYEPGAIVHHTHRATLEDLERQIHGYGVGFTAMLTAIALRNPRHLAGLATVIPTWLRSLRNPESPKQHRGEEYPAGLGATEIRGMLAGPVAYLRARRMQRRWAA